MSVPPVATLMIVALFAWPLPSVAGLVQKASPKQMRKELDALWLDLLSADELIAGRAMLKFVGWKGDAVHYLRNNLKPLKMSKLRAKYQIEQLGSADEDAAKAAFEEFSYFDPRLALSDEELQEALLDKFAARRVGAVLCDLPMDALAVGHWHWHSPNGLVYRFNHGKTFQDREIAIRVADIGTHSQKASWVRAVRAVAVLEHIGGTGATSILAEMATGHPDAAPTKAAKRVLERMDQK